jgi:hypothetical protein
MSTDLQKSWPWFVPAWIHAVALSLGLYSLLSRWIASENAFGFICAAALWGAWLPAIVSIRRRLITFEHAALFVSIPYITKVVLSLATMAD